ncbi:hypothetical protein, partial [Peribacillus simplex]|uniref:hypothetical protein n=1 Tax=Peribacillus simplex TaxID=1478 RepID=UPI0019D4F086
RRSLVPSIPINWNFFFKKYCRETGFSSPIHLQSGGFINFSTKGIRIALPQNQDFKSKLDYLVFY